MFDATDFRHHAHQFVEWMADYLDNVESYPVRPKMEPGSIYDALPQKAPETGEPMEAIFRDFQKLIVPGMTHWQSPNFFAYFPGNSSLPSLLAEMLTATMGAQCMIWDTSPAAAELEEKMMDWLKQLFGLPNDFDGVIQDTASTATLTAILSAREKATEFATNLGGLQCAPHYRVYCSSEAHSSVDKAIAIAGLGKNNLVKVSVDDELRMEPGELHKCIRSDLQNGLHPLCVVATLGTTSTTAIDPLKEIGKIARKENLWLHVDAAFAGTSLALPEFRWMIQGIEYVDSFVMNPHKWMFTNFDCSAYFVKSREALIRTFEILPEYLKTKSRGRVNDYRDWGIQLGRRFRALKLWFVLRSFGVQGIQEKLRHHLLLAEGLAAQIEAHPHFEITAPRPLNLICFRYWKKDKSEEALNALNTKLINRLNDTGKVYLTHTKVNGKFSLRMVIGQTNVEQKHVDTAWELIQAEGERL